MSDFNPHLCKKQKKSRTHFGNIMIRKLGDALKSPIALHYSVNGDSLTLTSCHRVSWEHDLIRMLGYDEGRCTLQRLSLMQHIDACRHANLHGIVLFISSWWQWLESISNAVKHENQLSCHGAVAKGSTLELGPSAVWEQHSGELGESTTSGN